MVSFKVEKTIFRENFKPKNIIYLFDSNLLTLIKLINSIYKLKKIYL